jgi:hypothetical protein
MQNWESLAFATVLASIVTFLFLWVLQYAFNKIFNEKMEQDFQETLTFEDRRKSTVINLVLEKVISVEKKVISIDKKLSK